MLLPIKSLNVLLILSIRLLFSTKIQYFIAKYVWLHLSSKTQVLHFNPLLDTDQEYLLDHVNFIR